MIGGEETVNVVEHAGNVGEFINDYGFMIVFSALVIVLLFRFFSKYSDALRKKSDAELGMLQKEREASINQNNQMFTLVTEVQTSQISQLQEMTSLLKDINLTVNSTHTRVEINENDIKKLGEDLVHIDDNYEYISKTLGEILSFVSQSDQYNKEVYHKVLEIEKSLDIMVSKYASVRIKSLGKAVEAGEQSSKKEDEN